MPAKPDYEALVLAALHAASKADDPERRAHHLNMAAVHAYEGEKANIGKVLDDLGGDS